MTRTIGFVKATALALPLSFGAWAAQAADLVETARQADQFNILLRALEAAGLTETLKGEGPFTVFAPTDEAFAKLPQGTLDELLREGNRERLETLLKHHVVEGEMLPSDTIPTELEPMAGGPISVIAPNGELMLRSGGEQRSGAARAVQGDIEADNGVIHAIDAVLEPQELASQGLVAALSGLLPPPAPGEGQPIPFSGSLSPADPPPSPAPPPRPVLEHEKQALDVLYERPAPMGPPPIPREPAAAVSVVGKGQVFRILPGAPAFPDMIPRELLVANGDASAFSQNMVLLPGGEVRFAASDRTVNDTKLSEDRMAFEASFTDEEGNDWRVVELAIAPFSPDPILDPWYGGVAIDVQHHGQLMRGTPAHPLIQCDMCSWGWADVWKNGQKVGSSALLHVMLASTTHDLEADYHYTCYDCTDRPVGEVHMVVTQANLPTPGGFLHVMWHESKVTRGTPEEIEANPAVRQPDLPTLTLNAVPYLQWSDTELEVQAGQPVRLVLNNMDPSSFHGFVVRGPQGLVQVPLEQGSQWVTSLVFDQPGEYEFWCPVANHRGRGMYGRVIVSEGVPGGTQGAPGEQ